MNATALATTDPPPDQAESNALDQLRADYQQLCKATARAGLARAKAKARRDRASKRYYQIHAEYLAIDAIASALERQVAIGFTVKLTPELRTALAPDMRAARISAGLQPTAPEARYAPERHYAEST